MTPEELSKIRQIYEGAVPMDAPARAAYLERECRGNEGIRQEVERLLKGRDCVPAWLDQPALGVAKALAGVATPKLEGRSFCGYTMLREIGRGGTGIVYLAERSDGTFHRQAAIKLVLPPASSPAVFARFQQEREILASLNHPNIAKLLDAGVTGEGWPFFVMEFVDGQPIHRWCDDRKLTIRQRLELFSGVISAVRFAHQHLVVHRDLKPGNILVTNDGVVKLLDFGIAKVVQPNILERTPDTLTLAGMMTPEYASPEQVNGRTITTLSDVYSLGVVLYELLTGHRPYRLRSAALHEMVRIISDVEPARPSEVVATSEQVPSPLTPETVSAVREGDPTLLRKRLAGDLDSILLMALRKDPERRYVSVESFAEDHQRHQEQRPGHARKASRWERFQHFRRRNPGGFLAAGLVAILFLAGLLAVVLQSRHEILASGPDRGSVLFLAPFWLFSAGIVVAALYGTMHIAHPSRRQQVGAATAGLAFGLGLFVRLRLEHSMGLWWSRVEGNHDPLMLLSPVTGLIFPLIGATLLVLLLMAGRRFGWNGQLILLLVIGLYQATRQRLWFGEFIPALNFQPGLITMLASAGIIFAAGLLGLVTMRIIAGAEISIRKQL